MLINYGADFRKKNAAGKTALEIALDKKKFVQTTEILHSVSKPYYSGTSGHTESRRVMDEESESQVDEEVEKRQRRKELLEPTGVKELFKDGKIDINKLTCVGGQCRLCIKACPTNALYGERGKSVLSRTYVCTAELA